jgi:hypothetical protein
MQTADDRIGRICANLSVAVALFSAVLLTDAHTVQAQQLFAIKNGESVEIGTVYYVVNCRSTMIGKPEVEILEDPPQLTITIKEGMVLPRRANCAAKVPGGTLVATVKDVQEATEAKLTYRVKYKTKDGDRQVSVAYRLSLFP